MRHARAGDYAHVRLLPLPPLDLALLFAAFLSFPRFVAVDARILSVTAAVATARRSQTHGLRISGGKRYCVIRM